MMLGADWRDHWLYADNARIPDGRRKRYPARILVDGQVCEAQMGQWDADGEPVYAPIAVQPLTFGSVFAGIGGLDLGLERAGMRCAWQVEIDDYAQQILARHWPDVPKHRDIRDCGAHNLAPVDLICGGFPCQPHSLAGKRGGANDDRDLWPEYRRIIRDLRPKWVVAENVPGLLSIDHGRFFGGLLRDLATLGYDAEWSVLSACAVGAPHTRERVFVVAYPTASRCNWRGFGEALSRHPHGNRTLNAPCNRPVQSTHWQAHDYQLRRVADGVSRRMDKGKRLAGLGNAVVPQVAELLGRAIVAAERGMS